MPQSLTPTGDNRIVGVVDSVATGWVRGWAWDSGNPARRLVVEVRRSGRIIASGVARGHREDLEAVGIGDGRYGFEIELPAVEWDDSLRVVTGDHALRVGVVPAAPEAPDLEAVVEGVSAGVVTGWARFVPPTEAPPKLIVAVNGKPIDEVTANQLRPDLRDLGMEGHHGFQCELPADEVDGEPFELALLRADAGEELVVARRLWAEPPQRGIVDQLGVGCLRGWRIDYANPQTPAPLEVIVDDVLYAQIETGEPRPDIPESIAPKSARPGFQIGLPSWLPPAAVQVRFADSKRPLPVLGGASATESTVRELRSLPASPNIEDVPLAVVVTIYNAADALARCLEALRMFTGLDARFVFIDDASTDPMVARLLAPWAEVAGCQVVRNPRNLGYTATANIGLAAHPDHDVVLLNSDTEVGPGWLRQLCLTAYRDSDIGTVSAISNNAGAFSYPEANQDNPLPDGLSQAELATMVRQEPGALRPELPTGNGFCMYIKRSVLEQVGEFDESAFPTGYGEENDLCMRAGRLGWRHIQDDRVWVYHSRSASFGERRTGLARAGLKTVNDRYPEYSRLVESGMSTARRYAANHRVRRIMARASERKSPPRPRALFVISTHTGGTPLTNHDLMRQIRGRYEPFLLFCQEREVVLETHDESKPQRIVSHVLVDPVNPVQHRSSEYDQVVAQWLVDYAIDVIHVRHIGWHSLGLTRVASRLGVPLVFSFHDYYTVCPSLKLLDDRGKFCAGVCTEGQTGSCRVELWPAAELPPLKHHFVNQWRANMEGMLRDCTAYVTTTHQAKELLCSRLALDSRRAFHIIPHGRTFQSLRSPVKSGDPTTSDGVMRLLFPGHMNYAKGAELIKAIKARDGEDRLEFHFAGSVSSELAALGVAHGEYQRDDLGGIIADIDPHLVVLLSVWPETYCHTLTEAWAAGVPVLGSHLGAIGERISRHQAGWLVRRLNASAIYRQLRDIAASPEGYARRLGSVAKWQQSYGAKNTAQLMAQRYAKLFDQLVFPWRRRLAAADGLN